MNAGKRKGYLGRLQAYRMASGVWNDMRSTTQNVKNTMQVPSANRKLLHLWEARRGQIPRWKKQLHNGKLKKRLAGPTAEATRYAAQLCRENWLSLCDSVKGILSSSKKRRLENCLIDPGNI